ncbi:MAG: ravA 2 [Phycisphaerales bacterium]|nr:ravA 2 [Phycisphaerales bacterium]
MLLTEDLDDRTSRRTNHAAAEIGRRLVDEVLSPMKSAFVGKDEIIDLMGVALVAGENLFLLGPPGTAKSALVYELGRRLRGRTFEYLLTRFTEPNELFGPFDIRKLREGELVTNTEGMLPEASLVFLDELLNANSAILNSLLTVLNERVFRRGKETRKLPVIAVFGASNRLPEDDALGAMFDRFLLRVTCDNVAPERLGDVLRAGWELDQRDEGSTATLDIDDVRRLYGMLGTVELTDLRPKLTELIIRLRHAGIAVSDRRSVKLQRLVAASALLCGRTRALASDLWILRHVWDTIEQREVLASIVGDALKSAPTDPRDHPRSRAEDAPDPESLALDLEGIGGLLGNAATSDADRAALRDRLAILAARVQWVQDAAKRSFLVDRIEALWPAAGGKP